MRKHTALIEECRRTHLASVAADVETVLPLKPLPPHQADAGVTDLHGPPAGTPVPVVHVVVAVAIALVLWLEDWRLGRGRGERDREHWRCSILHKNGVYACVLHFEYSVQN